ncbi:MAG TPA: MFS transporter, partial [Microlunatus sp.]|nr:MFS transporter [Microlunatus sp.]
NVAVAAFFLTLLTRVGGAGTFVIFGLLAVAAFVFVFKLAPETKGRPLDDVRHFWENGGTWPAETSAELSEPVIAETIAHADKAS